MILFVAGLISVTLYFIMAELHFLKGLDPNPHQETKGLSQEWGFRGGSL